MVDDRAQVPFDGAGGSALGDRASTPRSGSARAAVETDCGSQSDWASARRRQTNPIRRGCRQEIRNAKPQTRNKSEIQVPQTNPVLRVSGHRTVAAPNKANLACRASESAEGASGENASRRHYERDKQTQSQEAPMSAKLFSVKDLGENTQIAQAHRRSQSAPAGASLGRGTGACRRRVACQHGQRAACKVIWAKL